MPAPESAEESEGAGFSCCPRFELRMQKETVNGLSLSVLALPIFPGRFQPSIVGSSELNFRVRNGNGWTLALISTNFYCNCFRSNKPHYSIRIYYRREANVMLRAGEEKQRRE